jgi:tRNA nucleotidyltransferase/poly(A) polymerase
MTMKFTMPEHVQAVIDAAKEIGIELTLVGGALRDAVLGGEVSDYDLVFFSDHDSMYTHIMELDRDLGFTLQHH